MGWGGVAVVVLIQHTARNCHRRLSEAQLIGGQNRAGPKQPPLFVALWRHLNELQIDFILAASASLRMEMMMDNNDATTGSPSCR